METESLIKDYEREKHQERKRKGAHLESLFENSGKKSAPNNNDNNNDRILNKYSEEGNLTATSSPEISLRANTHENIEKSTSNSRNSLENNGNNLENVVSSYGDPSRNTECSPEENISCSGNTIRSTRNGIANTGNRMQHARTLNSENISRSVAYENDHDSNCQSRQSERDSPDMEERETHHYSAFKQINGSKESKASELETSVVIKQEKPDEASQVQVIPRQAEKVKNLTEDNGEIGEDCLKFLLFSGKLYRCERISDLNQTFSRFVGESVLGRKGKVVVVLLFHKTLREVLNYVVGVVDHYTLEEHNIIIKIIKHHTYPTTSISAKEVEKSASKLVVGSKKLLYNLQLLNGPVYAELVKILDGFGANSSVDHAKVSEFNAMVNANADRLDGPISNVLGRSGFPFRVAFGNRNFVSTTHMGSRFPQGNPTYTPLANHLSTSTRYSPEKSHGGSSYDRSKSDTEMDSGYQRRNASYYRDGHYVNTVSANQSVRITPRTTNNIRSSSAVPIVPNPRYRSAIEEASLASPRRNVEDLQTVAELCKEKMKRDMAEQELKTIKAAFEEFKSQMQQHLSQVEERMVLLEAENRTLKGKLSNLHQNNGFAEKKYHELRSQLEDLLKSA